MDIGAHIGYFTIMAAKNASLGRIYSIEPHKESFEILKKNLLLNNFTNVDTFNVAITKSTGKTRLYIDKNNQIGNTIIKNNNSNESEQVDTFSLRNFVKNSNIEQIDFLKVDCEGAEFEIFLNLEKELLKKIKKISAEIHEYGKNNSIMELKEFFEKNGFSIKISKILEDPTLKLSMLYAKNKNFK
ncbi:trans-aconitate 2-methyltransferase protein [Marine Group I thaumarchaeote SCGC AAA799-P11]|uniref:Trans-aconitate 2-methyltransferase protein n=1 Tax=Marine Group I thaumarchaeote SCGC AAA799-P11 TaxID=1502295 RepID=A0A087S2Y0_9ARCH|nr:trans-aconitate 2-methyltransferase protein [Marine Group I thaumarchaeote SCGC AAA799-P11]